MKPGRLPFLVVAAAGLFITSAFAAPPPADEIIPLVEMENVPLPEAIRQLARQARLNVILDPRLSSPPHDRVLVSFRWQNVTARDALTALLENHDLVLVEK